MQARRLLAIAPSRGMMAAALLSLAIAAAFLLVPRPERVEPVRDGFIQYPTSLGDWRGMTRPMEPEIAAVLAATDYIDISFAHPSETATVNFFSVSTKMLSLWQLVTGTRMQVGQIWIVSSPRILCVSWTIFISSDV